ncbi:MAG: SPOR domain-containing protein [Marinifilaceae bacterium]|jgi:hypothetical protein|nr:SPOR domain-containing protein [Marinifilaceae bacterium]
MNKIYLNIFTLVCVFTLCIGQTSSQNLKSGLSEEQAEGKAFKFFNSQDYINAMRHYQELIDVYPQDAEYNYYLGVCQVELNTDIPEAIKHLKIAAGKNVDDHVSYYLARAFHLNYQFNSALRYYRKYKERFGKKAKNVDLMIQMCINALPLVNLYYVVDVESKQKLNLKGFYNHYKIDGVNEKLSKLPKYFQNKYNNEDGFDTACTDKEGKFIYFSSYGKSKKTGRNLYRAKALDEGGWGDWEELTALNSKYDEVFPFFSDDGRTLYFSSQGHSSMGGFDIFKSVYNSITKTWTEPVNIGFPYNSTSDDFFYTVTEDNKVAEFASNRENNKDNITIYKLNLPRYQEQKPVMSPDDLPKIALIGQGKEAKMEYSPPMQDETKEIEQETEANTELTANNNTSKAQNTNDTKLEEPEYSNKYNESLIPYFNLSIPGYGVYHNLEEFRSSEAKAVYIKAKNDEFNADSLAKIINYDKALLKSASELESIKLNDRIKFYSNFNSKYTQSSELKVDKAIELELATLKGTGVKQTAVAEEFVEETMDDVPKTDNGFYKLRERGIHYYIQVGLFSNQQKLESFGSFNSAITEKYIDNLKLYRYLVGSFARYASAWEELKSIKPKHPNAFIVVYKSGVKTTVDKTLNDSDPNYEHEPWDEYLAKNNTANKDQAKKEISKKSNAKDITFSIQVGAFAGEVPGYIKDKLKKFKKYKINYSRGVNNYLILSLGKFTSYSKASNLKQELREGGLEDAFTVAYQGDEKISVVKAVEILKKKKLNYYR